MSTRRVILRDSRAFACRSEASAAVRLLIFPYTSDGLKAAGVHTIDMSAPKVPTNIVAKNVHLWTPKGRDGVGVVVASHATAGVSGSTLQSVSCNGMTVLLKNAPGADGDANGWFCMRWRC